MTLIENARDVLLKAWSMRLWALSTLLMVVEFTLPMFESQVPPRTFMVLSFIAGIAGMGARLMQQLGLSAPPKDGANG
jgi:hypothetical protein